MASMIKFVKPEHAEILSQYLPFGINQGVTLVFGKESQAKASEQGLADGKLDDTYDFMGDADCLLDMIDSPDHPALNQTEE